MSAMGGVDCVGILGEQSGHKTMFSFLPRRVTHIAHLSHRQVLVASLQWVLHLRQGHLKQVCLFHPHCLYPLLLIPIDLTEMSPKELGEARVLNGRQMGTWMNGTPLPVCLGLRHEQEMKILNQEDRVEEIRGWVQRSQGSCLEKEERWLLGKQQRRSQWGWVAWAMKELQKRPVHEPGSGYRCQDFWVKWGVLVELGGSISRFHSCLKMISLGAG